MVTDIFAVIADRTRREILDTLRTGDKAVGELVEVLEASQPTVSKHLKVLRDAGLVTTRAQGQKRYYTLRVEPLGEVGGWIEGLRTTSGSPDVAAGSPAALVGSDGAEAPASEEAVLAVAAEAPAALATDAVDAPAAVAGTVTGTGAATGPAQLQRTVERTVERAAARATELMASLPKFGRRK